MIALNVCVVAHYFVLLFSLTTLVILVLMLVLFDFYFIFIPVRYLNSLFFMNSKNYFHCSSNGVHKKCLCDVWSAKKAGAHTSKRAHARKKGKTYVHHTVPSTQLLQFFFKKKMSSVNKKFHTEFLIPKINEKQEAAVAAAAAATTMSKRILWESENVSFNLSFLFGWVSGKMETERQCAFKQTFMLGERETEKAHTHTHARTQIFICFNEQNASYKRESINLTAT